MLKLPSHYKEIATHSSAFKRMAYSHKAGVLVIEFASDRVYAYAIDRVTFAAIQRAITTGASAGQLYNAQIKAKFPSFKL